MRTSDAHAALLAGVPFFDGLPPKELRAVLDETREESYPAGTVIVAEGDPGGRFHLVVDGTARVELGGRVLDRLEPGRFFGELSLIDRGPRSATVLAETDVRTRSLTSFSFLALLDAYPDLSRRVMAELCRRIRRLEAASAT